MVSAPGPVISMTFLKSSSVQIFGMLPMNNLYFVSDSEHLKVLPYIDGTPRKAQIRRIPQKDIKE